MSGQFGDLIQTIDGLRGPPYVYYGGSAFVPPELPPVGAMWLPGHRLAAKVPGARGTVFYTNGPYRWQETSGETRSYPEWGQQILATEPTGWDIRTGMFPRGHYFPGQVGPSVAGLGAFGQGFELTAEGLEYLKEACKDSPNQMQCFYEQLLASGVSREDALQVMRDVMGAVMEHATPRPDLVQYKKAVEPAAVPTWVPWAVGGAVVAGVAAFFLLRR